MTLSTVGLVPAIRRMSHEPEQVGLAVSLHAPDDELRDRLVPVNRRYPLASLMHVCRDYIAATRRRVTFEYALMDGVNDSDEQAGQLADLHPGHAGPREPHPPQPHAGQPLLRLLAPAGESLCRRYCWSAGIPATVRLRRGIDIQAGCGQLRAQFADRSIPDSSIPVL